MEAYVFQTAQDYAEAVRELPRLEYLLAAARAEAPRGADPNALYVRYKRMLEPLVGFCAGNKRLCGAAEYETVLKALCDAVGL